MKAFIFPGQGSQFPGMGKELFEKNDTSADLFNSANNVLGFDITKIMFEGTAEELNQTSVTQPAIFLHSVITALTADNFKPDMVAGHSLGEFSSLVANKTLSFENGFRLVAKRASAMQKACEASPSTMAAVLGLEDSIVEQVCRETDGIVVTANYNCPGQLVISGSLKSVEDACSKLMEAGARRAIPLPVGGAFHSPLMEPARAELAEAILSTDFSKPTCPIYQNANANPSEDIATIKENLIAQLTSPVLWTQTIENMIGDGAQQFIECGPGKVLQGLVRKINSEVETSGI